MENDFESRYHHGSPGSGNRHTEERRNDLRDGDFGREYENRYRSNDGRNRMSYDAYKSDNKWMKSSVPSWDERRATRGYGVEDSAGGSGYGYDSDRNGNDRTPGSRDQGGYGTGRMGGYSGSGFGGSNYSSHGSFSGNSAYGSMSGGGGNVGWGASSSGYGNQNSYSDRGVPDYDMSRLGRDSGSGSNYGATNYSGGTGHENSNRSNAWGERSYGGATENFSGRSMGLNTSSEDDSYKGYGSNNSRNGSGKSERSYDRGGYYNYDPNNRWNS